MDGRLQSGWELDQGFLPKRTKSGGFFFFLLLLLIIVYAMPVILTGQTFRSKPPSFSDSPIISIVGGATAFVTALIGLAISVIARLFTSAVSGWIDFFWDKLPVWDQEVRFALAVGIISFFVLTPIRRSLKRYLGER